MQILVRRHASQLLHLAIKLGTSHRHHLRQTVDTEVAVAQMTGCKHFQLLLEDLVDMVFHQFGSFVVNCWNSCRCTVPLDELHHTGYEQTEIAGLHHIVIDTHLVGFYLMVLVGKRCQHDDRQDGSVFVFL